MYNFTLPMPNNINMIDKLVEINTKLKKSKINCLYFSIDYNSDNYTGFEQSNSISNKTLSFEEWIEIATYANKKGFKTIYSLNALKACDFGVSVREEQFRKLDYLIKTLYAIGCNTYEISDFEVLTHIVKNYKNIEIHSSGAHEYLNIKQYQNYKEIFPNINHFTPGLDANRNFLLLKNLKTQFKDIVLQLTVNEGCMFNCPFRYSHIASKQTALLSEETKELIKNINKNFPQCEKLFKQDPFREIIKANVIHPWDIDEYGKINIVNFRLVGRDTKEYDTNEIYEDYFIYLKGIDDWKDIQDEKYSRLSVYAKNHGIDFTIKEIKPYLPKISHFIKKGHLCASECHVECNYCHECAEKFKKYLEKRDKK